MANGDGDGFQIPAGEVVMKTALDFDGVEEDLEELAKKGEAAGEETGESVSKGAEKAAGAADALGKGLKGASEGAEDVSETAGQAGTDIGEMAETAESAAQTSAGLAVVMGRKLVGGLRGAVGWLGRTTAGFLSLSAEGLQQAGQGLKELGRDLRDSESRFAALGIAVEGAGSALEGVAGVAAKVASAITGMHVAVGIGAAALANAAQNASEDFVPSWQRVVTIITAGNSEIERGSEAIKDLEFEVSNLAGELGVAGEVANDTFYQILSAMPEVIDQPEKSLQVLRAALSVVATGFAEGETAARAITSVLNAFQMEASQATKVADMIFAAQDQGVLTFQQVATEIGKVSNLTSSMNAEFEDLLGILATVTPSGENVNRVMTQIRSVLGEMLDPTEELNEALGGSATGFVRNRGLLAALQRIAEVTGGNPEVVAEMFGRKEAQSLIITLSQNMDQLVEKTEKVGNASGETSEKLDIMNQSLDRAKTRFSEELNTALRNVGRNFESFGALVVGVAADVVGAINEMDKRMREASRRGIRMSGVTGRRFGAPVQPRGGLEDIPARFGGPEPLLPVSLAFPPDLPAQRAEELVAEAEKWLERRRPMDRPSLPANIEFSRDQIETMQTQAELAAFLDFSRTRDLEAYREALEDAQRRVNDLVMAEAKRLEQAGVEAAEIQKLLSLFDASVERAQQQREALEDLSQSLSDYVDNLRDARSELQEFEPPELPDVGGAGPGEGPAGFRAAFEAGADTSGVTEAEMSRLLETLRRINEEAGTSDEAFRMAQEALDDTDISVEQLRESTSGLANAIITELLVALPDVNAEMLGLAEGSDDAEDNTRDLADEVENLAQLAGGVLQLADAFGIFGDEASQALQQGVSAATQLAQGVDSLKEALAEGASGFSLAGPIGAIAGGAAGLIGAIGGLFEESQTDIRLREEAAQAAEALQRLRDSAEAVRGVFGDIPGEDIARLQEAMQEGVDFTSIEDVDTEDAVNASEGTIRRLTGADDLQGILNDLGLSISDLEGIAESAGINIDDLLAAMRGTFTGENSIEAARRQFERLQEAMKELELEQAVEGVAGRLDLLEQEFELMDVDDPVEQLRRLREELLGLEEVPDSIQQAIAGADLSTEEGRKQAEQAIQDIFRQLQAGELSAEDLGGLTLTQFRDILGQLEGTLDEAAEQAAEEGEEGDVGGFQQTRQITEVTGNRLTALLTTSTTLDAQRNRLLGRILTTLGGKVPGNISLPSAGAVTPPAPQTDRQPRTSEGGEHTVFQFDDVLGGDLIVEVKTLAGDPDTIGNEISRETLRKIDRGLAELLRDRERGKGRF